jgi:hypothetical protein
VQCTSADMVHIHPSMDECWMNGETERERVRACVRACMCERENFIVCQFSRIFNFVLILMYFLFKIMIALFTFIFTLDIQIIVL